MLSIGKSGLNNKTLSWGAKYQHEMINDRLNEWQLIDSSGFSMPQGVDSLLRLFEFIESENELNSSRLSSYVQQSARIELIVQYFHIRLVLELNIGQRIVNFLFHQGSNKL